jgi:hypothetical protein
MKKCTHKRKRQTNPHEVRVPKWDKNGQRYWEVYHFWDCKCGATNVRNQRIS